MPLPRSPFSRLFASLAVGAVLLAGCGTSDNEPTDPRDTSTVEQSQDANEPTGGTETDSGEVGGEEAGNGSPGAGNGADGASDEGEELVLPPKSDFTEDIELARSMTADEVEAYNEDLMAELNEEYNQTTKSEYEILLQELDELEGDFLPEYETLNEEKEQAFENLGDSASPAELEAYAAEFGDRKRELDARFETQQQEVHNRFMEATEPKRLEFEPRFIAEHARYTYMLEVAKDA